MALSNIDMFIADIYFLSANIRDTLSYTMEKYDESYENYQNRKKRIEAGLRENSPLANFIKSNAETGQKISTIINNFLEEVYGDNSTIFSKEGDDRLIADKAQAIKIYEFVVGIHETLSDIVNGYLKNAVTSGQNISKDLKELVKLGNGFYRSYVYVALISTLLDLYKEFSAAMTESKGQQTPQSNFINHDINKIVNYLRFVKEHATNPDPEMQKFMDKAMEVVQMMQGEISVPEGRTIWQEFDEARNEAALYFNKVAPTWQQVSIKMNELGREYVQRQQELAKNAKTDN